MTKRPLRIQCLDDVFVVSNRTFQNELMLPTDPMGASRIRGALFRFGAKYDISFFAYTFLANGYWMVVRAPNAKLPSFMRDFQSWLGKYCNACGDREGDFFHDRYEDEAIVDVDAMIETIVDVLVAPVREGFVEHLGDFEGASTWLALRNGQHSVGEWINRERLYSLRRSNPELPESATATEYRMELASLPAETSGADSTASLVEKVEARVEGILEWRAEHADEPELLTRTKPHPTPWSASPVEPIGPPRYFYRYFCRAGREENREVYREIRADLRAGYTDAMTLWRKGKDEWCSNGVCVVQKRREVDRARGRLVGRAVGVAKRRVRVSVNGRAVEARRHTDPRPEEEIDFPTSSIPPGWVGPRRPLRPGMLGPPPDPGRNAA